MAVEWDGWVVRDGGVLGGAMLLKFRPIKVQEAGQHDFSWIYNIANNKVLCVHGLRFCFQRWTGMHYSNNFVRKESVPAGATSSKSQQAFGQRAVPCERWRSLCKRRHRPSDPWNSLCEKRHRPLVSCDSLEACKFYDRCANHQ